MIYEAYDALEMQPNHYKKRLMLLIVIAHYTASIIAHQHVSNMLVVFSDCLLGMLQRHSVSNPDISNIMN